MLVVIKRREDGDFMISAQGLELQARDVLVDGHLISSNYYDNPQIMLVEATMVYVNKQGAIYIYTTSS